MGSSRILTVVIAASGWLAGVTASGVEGGLATGRVWQPGESLCVLLGPGDFMSPAGLEIAAPEDNGDGAGGHYCLYTPGRYPIKGGIEFDAFLGPDAEVTFANVAGGTASGVDAKLPGADASTLSLGGAVTTSIVVRRGALVFAISLPQGEWAEAELRRLAALVLSRAGKAAG